MQISYIGMQTQEVIIKPTLKVILKADAQKLDEIVVTAMGISREKKALGYAVQDVKSDVLTRAANTDLAGALQGKVSGIDITPSSGMPGASSKITIRGSRSFTGDNTPLYVIDGMPIASTADVSTSLTDGAYGTDYANRAVDIDPNDIESINILKGQAASALYGMRASNGVIVITTKSGKGANKGKPNITFSTNLSFDKISTLPELQQEYAQSLKEYLIPYHLLHGVLESQNYLMILTMVEILIIVTPISMVNNQTGITFLSLQQPVWTLGLLQKHITT